MPEVATQETLAEVVAQAGPKSSLQATSVKVPQLPVNTASSESKLDPQVLAVRVPQIPVTFHHMFLYGPSQVDVV